MQRTELPGVHRCAARQAIITNLRLVLQEAHEIQKGANSSLSIGAIELRTKKMRRATGGPSGMSQRLTGSATPADHAEHPRTGRSVGLCRLCKLWSRDALLKAALGLRTHRDLY